MGYYKCDYIKQGTDEWRSWRKGIIGASDAPTIMQENPWKSLCELEAQKLGLFPEFSGNAVTREGKKLEPEAREKLMAQQRTDIKATLIQDAEIPFLAASLDGLDRTNGKVYEIKCGRYAYRETAYWKSPPSYYTAQLQHILMITGFDEITYVAYRPKQKLIVLQIGRDSRYIRNLRATEECFAARLMKRGHRFQANFMGSFIA